jgi:UDP-glucose 4-epimerase
MTTARSQNILLTGGAGFIGSALIPVLLSKGYHVTAVDHLSTGRNQNLDSFLARKDFEFIQLDLLDVDKLKQVVKNSDLIYHLAANAEVRKGQFDTEVDYLNNVVTTRNLLDIMRSSDRCKKIIFTSSSVVYGEPSSIPTPENYGPLKPISLYGASKLACEALISGYVGTFGIDAVIFRLANIVGPSGHGVIFDFLRKLAQSEGKYLEILGDGTQKKSYLYIDDCINALALGLDQLGSGMEIFNVGSDDQVDTNSIARIIIGELGLQTEIKYAPQQKDGRGWPGDVKNMLLSTDRLKKIGWRNTHSSENSVSLTVKKIVDHNYKKDKFDFKYS